MRKLEELYVDAHSIRYDIVDVAGYLGSAIRGHQLNVADHDESVYRKRASTAAREAARKLLALADHLDSR